jgi:hypothetical protein
MPIVEVSIPNLKELLFNLKRYPAISEKWLQKAIMASGAELHKAARRGIVPWRTGRLVQSFQVAIGRLMARVWPDVKYAVFVHEGTRPHLILPKSKRALYWEGARHPVRSVQHPGTRENRFLNRMVKLAEPQIIKHFKEAGDNILKEIGKT